MKRSWRFDTDMTDGDNYDTPHHVLCRSNYQTESTGSDSSSSVAPTDFRLSESLECSTQGAAVSVALERCWLCLGSRRSFYCKQCVRNGDFVHSRPLQQPVQPSRPLADLERYVTTATVMVLSGFSLSWIQQWILWNFSVSVCCRSYNCVDIISSE